MVVRVPAAKEYHVTRVCAGFVTEYVEVVRRDDADVNAGIHNVDYLARAAVDREADGANGPPAVERVADVLKNKKRPNAESCCDGVYDWLIECERQGRSVSAREGQIGLPASGTRNKDECGGDCEK
jgi:hypothetical protein